MLHRVAVDGPAILTGLVVTPRLAQGDRVCDAARPSWRLWEIVDGEWFMRQFDCDVPGRSIARLDVEGGTWVFEAVNSADEIRDLSVFFEAVEPGPRPSLPINAGQTAIINTPDARDLSLLFDAPEHGGIMTLRLAHCWSPRFRVQGFDVAGTPLVARENSVECGAEVYGMFAREMGVHRVDLGFEVLFGAVSLDFQPAVARLGANQGQILVADEVFEVSGSVAGGSSERYFRLHYDLRLDMAIQCEGDSSLIVSRVQPNGDREHVIAWNDTFEDWGALINRCPGVEPLSLPAGDYVFEFRRSTNFREAAGYELSMRLTVLPEPPPPPVNIDDGFVVGDTDLRLPSLQEREGEFVDLRVNQRARVTMEVNDGAGGCPGNSFMILFDEDSNPVAQDGSSGPGLCSRISRVLDPGEYSIGVRSGGGRLPPYVLQIRYTLP